MFRFKWQDCFYFAPDDGAGSGASAPAAPSASSADAPAAGAGDSADSRGSEGSTTSAADAYAASQAAAAVPPAAQVPAAQSPAAAQSPSAPAAGAAAAVPGATPPPVTVAGVREFARSIGIDPARYADDASMLRDLVAAAQQSQVYRTEAQRLAQQQTALLQRLTAPMAQPVQPAAGGQQAQKPAWQGPEWNPAWESQITRDDKGNITGVKPGVPFDVLTKYTAAQNWRREFADRLLSNPAEALGPMIADEAKRQAGEMVEQHLQTYQDRVWTDSFIAQNTAWLHARDAAGNTLVNPATGKPLLSPQGQLFTQYVVQADRMGVRDLRAQENYARGMLQRDLLMAQHAQAQAAPNGAAAQAAVIAGANRRPNQTGTLPGSGPIPATVAQNAGLSLKDQLAQALQAQGVTDEAINL